MTARKRRGDEAGRASESHRHKRFIQGNCAAFHLKCFNAATAHPANTCIRLCPTETPWRPGPTGSHRCNIKGSNVK